jgi:hypothetical protein
MKGTHRVVTLRMPGGRPARILCLMQPDANGADAYYVLAENEGHALKWRSMVQGNAVRRLRTEFKNSILDEAEVDEFDVESIFLCTTEVSKA